VIGFQAKYAVLAIIKAESGAIDFLKLTCISNSSDGLLTIKKRSRLMDNNPIVLSVDNKKIDTLLVLLMNYLKSTKKTNF